MIISCTSLLDMCRPCEQLRKQSKLQSSYQCQLIQKQDRYSLNNSISPIYTLTHERLDKSMHRSSRTKKSSTIADRPFFRTYSQSLSPIRKPGSTTRRSKANARLRPLQKKNLLTSIGHWRAETQDILESVRYLYTREEGDSPTPRHIQKNITPHGHYEIAPGYYGIQRLPSPIRIPTTANSVQRRKVNPNKYLGLPSLDYSSQALCIKDASTEAFFSQEMQLCLDAHIQSALKVEGRGNNELWENKVTSRLARPLDASVFCADTKTLIDFHTAPSLKMFQQVERGNLQLAWSAIHSTTNNAQFWFPYSVVAHEAATKINRMIYHRLQFITVKVVMIQSCVRRYRAIRFTQRKFHGASKAASVIQRQIRWKLFYVRQQRQARGRLQRPAIQIQSGWRGFALRLSRFRHARLLQSCVRRFAQQHPFRLLKVGECCVFMSLCFIQPSTHLHFHKP